MIVTRINRLSGLAVSPSDIKGKLDEVNEAATSLDSEIGASTAPDTFKSDWHDFKAGWDQFYSDHTGGWFTSITNTGSTYDQAVDYGKRVQDWRDKFRKLGGTSYVPDLPADGMSVPWAKIMGVLGMLAVVGIVFKRKG